MILFEDEYAILEHDRVCRLISISWKKYTPSLAYRKIIGLFYELCLQSGAHRSLVDVQQLPTVSAEDSYWTVEMYKKYRFSLPVTRFAIVLMEGTFTKLAIRNMRDDVKQAYGESEPRLSITYFETVEAARTWLMEEENG